MEYINLNSNDGKQWSIDSNLKAEQIIGYLEVICARMKKNFSEFLSIKLIASTPKECIWNYLELNKYRRLKHAQILSQDRDKIYFILRKPFADVTNEDIMEIRKLRGVGNKTILNIMELIESKTE